MKKKYMFVFIDLNIQIKLVRAFSRPSQVKQIKSHMVSIYFLINLTSIELKLKLKK